ncbi:cytochrome P450 [Aspergillus tamarii]|uniref:Cytochrome P450 n=1 Tax=Aspergillus tamarii TaxID=41984 RepID=A0A5N6V5S6_ASPTM|nr:cytochrome P450 [Aspergillus tamarii]
MPHSLVFGHLPVVLQFYRDWAFDANFKLEKFFPNEDRCPPVIYVDIWPISRPMAFSMEAYVSNQVSIGTSLPKSPMHGEFLGPISNGKDLICMHGDEWRMWRSMFNRGFSRGNIRAWVPAILEEVEAFANMLRNLSGGNGDWGQVFPLEQISSNLAFDVTGRIVIGERLNTQSLYPSRFSVAYREQLQRMEITFSPRKLLWRATPLLKLLVSRKRDELFQILRPSIPENLVAPTKGSQTIVQAAAEDLNRIRGEDSHGPPDESLVKHAFYHLMAIFFGGDDAISITLPRIFKQLQLHPECLDKMRAEHDTVLGPDPSTAAQRLRDEPYILDSLKYTLSVVKETLRINPATITIRAGQPDFNFYIKDSNTPSEFIPERYLVPEGDILHPAKDMWRGFQLGPRRCLGQELAIVVLKLVLVLVAQQQGIKFAKQMVEGERMYTAGKATAHPKDGAPAHVRIRNPYRG